MRKTTEEIWQNAHFSNYIVHSRSLSRNFFWYFIYYS